jgi:AraC-like DNA-binding protein
MRAQRWEWNAVAAAAPPQPRRLGEGAGAARFGSGENDSPGPTPSPSDAVTMERARQRCPGRTQQRKQQVLLRLQRAQLLLDGQSHRRVSMAELAELTHFSSSYLSRAFRRAYGCAPRAYAAEARLQRARALLRETPLAVREVASGCGFQNACAFARAFQRRFGHSASAFRAGLAAASHPTGQPLPAPTSPESCP